MKAREVMNSAVVAVRPDTPVSGIAKTLRDHRISAVPVVDEGGFPIGMVSEGDLIGRDKADREAHLDWWLALLAEGEALSSDFVASLRAPERHARDVMAAPVVTAGEGTETDEVARLLTANRIKRVPVLRDGRIVGIVSRADLVRALAESKTQLTGDSGRTSRIVARRSDRDLSPVGTRPKPAWLPARRPGPGVSRRNAGRY